MATGDALTPRQRVVLVGATIVAGISRFLALARTPWDIDEVHFMQALDHFNVAAHAPHPPGFPLYIFAAKIVRKFGVGDFHALQALSIAAGILIVPAMFFFCRELGMRFTTSLSAALLLAFAPNVWFYGGTAFSDLPSIVIVIVAVAFLLRGRSDARAYLASAAILGCAAAMRPQNLLIGAAPFLLASWFQKRRLVLAVSIVILIVGVSYGIAASLTGFAEFREALREHAEYITRVDSFHSPTRPPLWRIFVTFFVMPYRAPVINTLVTLLGAISGVVSLAKRRQTVLIAAAAFAPFCVVALLYLDHFSASRFSIGYAPLIALLVADGAYLVARRWEVVLSGIIVAMMIIWTWPALVVARTTVSPPVAAVDWIRNHLDKRSAIIYVDDGMIPFAKRYLPDYRTRYIDTAQPPPTWTEHEPGYYLQESASPSPNAENFIRAPGRLWSLVRQRYFDVSVRPISELVVFDNGWYEEEGEGGAVWRWMGPRSVAILPPLNGEARLTLAMYFPLDALRTTPNVTIRINGALVDSFQAKTKSLEREIVVRARADGNNELLIATDRVVNPAAEHLGADARTLGLRLNSITWMPAQ